MGMTGKKETGAAWHHATVVLQPDIYRQALEQGIDISDACNQALASLTGREYHPLREEIPVPPPVIIAKNGASLPGSGEQKKGRPQLHPVINADDPAAAAGLVQEKIRPVKKAPAEIPAPVPAPVSPKEKPVPVPDPALEKATPPKGRETPVKKRSRGDALKTFFSAKIVRTDDADATISKDELYERFARFCRDHRITPVPDRKTVTVALKNQFALTEKMVDGTPFWTGIRLK
jgi:hypothetical protein